jgi:hypothetical protein
MCADNWPVSDSERRRRFERDRYQSDVGREPSELPEDHPDRWQWDYRGTKDEREGLLERLTEQPTVDVEQEPLPGLAA